MPFDLPQTPQSPSYTPGPTDPTSKSILSPRINTSLPTPAHSINGSMSSLNSAVEVSQTDDSTNKRKRDSQDLGDRHQKKVHAEDSRPNINDLHLDVGKKYFLCRTPHQPMQPSLSQDLFARYGLTEIAASVARVTPDGKKNTIRKTYKNYMKNLDISGQFDAVRKEWQDEGSLYSMFNPMGSTPTQELWDATHVRGQEIENGFSDEVRASISKAVIMARGPVPKERWNSSVLGELGPLASIDPTKLAFAKSKTPASGSTSVPRSNKTMASAPISASASASTSATSPADIARPKRSVKKRTYGDASYEGYGEGYVDDDAGYSTGDGDDRAGGRKRPKKTSTSHSFQGPMRQSYGPGMVGA